MFGFVKMAALSAVLSYGVVNALGPVETPAEPAPTKSFHDRVLPSGESSARLLPAVQVTGSVGAAVQGSKGDRLTRSAACEAQAWPYIADECLTRTDGAAAPKQVRMITIESRQGMNVSVLSRTPELVAKR